MARLIYFITLILLLGASRGQAFHIVGGELFYDCLGSNDYRITLKLYRDCAAQGSNVAPYGDPEHIAVFDNSGNVVRQIPIPFPGSDTLEGFYSNDCIVIPPDVCVEEAIYSKVVSLSPQPGGYELVYQRCCRNHTISNLTNPGQVGSTYSTHIPEPPRDCNSSPRFDNFPPVFICVNEQLNFDHAATDPDGDSLVYEACDPFLGASQTCPLPSPVNNNSNCPNQPSSPPYSPVPWAPGYSASNPLGGNTFAIDQQDGELTVTPPSQGQYVVGVCVKEYRNGQLIGRTKRDFQFNVVNCEAPFANVPTSGTDPSTGIGIYSVNCNDYTVSYQNQSSNAENYYWDFGDPTTQNDTSSAFEPSYTYPDTGSYVVTLVAEHELGCTDTTKAVVKVYPFFETDFDFSGLCQGEALSFTDRTSSSFGAVDSWTWDFDDGTTSSQTNPTHTYTSPGIYNVQLSTTSSKGCSHDTVKTVRVYPKPQAYYEFTNTCIGDSTFFTNYSDDQGDQIANYTWDLGDGTTTSIEDPDHYYSSTGSYQVSLTAESVHGCADTFSSTVEVYNLPNPQINPDTVVCKGESANLKASGGVLYNWEPAEHLDDSSIAQPTATVDTQTTFTVTVTDSNRCTDSASTTVSTKPLPTVTASSDTSICLGTSNSVQLDASGTPTYSWSPSTGLSCTNCQSPTASPSDTTTYTVTGTSTNGCTNNDSVRVDVLNPAVDPILPDRDTLCKGKRKEITAYGGDQYQWSPSTGLSDTDVQTPVFSPTTTTTYKVTVSNYCFSKTDSVTVVVIPSPSANAGSGQNICLGDSVQISGSGGNDQYWTPGSTLADSSQATTTASPDTSTTYVFTTTLPNGCKTRDSLHIDVFDPPDAQATGDTTICQGSGTPLQASGGSTYQWQPATDLSCTTCPDPVASPADTTSYAVKVSEIPGCARYDTVQVNVLQPVQASVAGNTEICQDDTVVLQGQGGLSYEWDKITGKSADTADQISISPDSSVTYRLIARNGCRSFADTISFTVDVNPLPPVDAGDDVQIFRERSTTLEATGGIDYQWQPTENLATPQSAETEASPFYTTTYTVTAENEYGCSALDSVTVLVEGKDILAVPTAFSPNDDGVNETFHIIEHLNIKELTEFTVYNRWGEKVFEGDDLDDAWDGTQNGGEVEMDTYLYVIEAVNYDGEKVTRSGNVTLVK